MVVNKSFEPPHLVVAALAGVVTTSDQRELVGWVRESIERAGGVRLLVTLGQFHGWQPSGSYDDPALWLRDDEGVSKIAIVGEAAWRRTVLTVIGQPLRRIPIDYFDTEAAARRWLSSESENALSS